MPKTKKTSTKKTAAKKSTSRSAKASRAVKKTAAVRTTATKKTQDLHPLKKSYLHHEQEEFHRAHPNANGLIATFIVAFGILVILYISKMY